MGFDPAALAGSPAAAVTFRVGTNGVSEVLIASSAKSASTVLAGHVPAECAQYQETVAGKTYTYGIEGKGDQRHRRAGQRPERAPGRRQVR